MSERLIVTMDGSTHVSTAALVGGGPGGWRVLARRTDTDSRGQARVLLRLIDDMLAETGRTSADMAALVTGIGPGTFTGVRIAVATARALALALDVPVLGVSTLAALAAEALAGAGGTGPEMLVPVVDARRGQVFYGVYRRKRDGSGYERADAYGVCDRGALFDTLPGVQNGLVVGDVGLLEDGAGRTMRALEIQAEYLVIGQDRLVELDGAGGVELDALLARALSGTRTGAPKAGDPGTPEAVKPIYVRSPDADIHITKMRDPWAETAPGA